MDPFPPGPRKKDRKAGINRRPNETNGDIEQGEDVPLSGDSELPGAMDENGASNTEQNPLIDGTAGETKSSQKLSFNRWNRWKMLTLFIAFKLVLPVVDISTDVYTGVSHLLDGSTYVGGITLGIICLPFILALLIHGKKPNKIISVFYHLPFAQIVKNLTIFEKLFNMDTDNTRQSAGKDKLLRESAELSSFEAFCESAPQMILQLVNFFWTGGIGIGQAIGILFSYFALTWASTLAFFQLRDKENADVLPNFWLNIRVLPAMGTLVWLSVAQWTILVIFIEQYSLVFFVVLIAINYYLLRRRGKGTEKDAMFLSSVIGLFVPCIVGKSKYILKTTLLVTLGVKTAGVIIALASNPTLARPNILICTDSHSSMKALNNCHSWFDCLNGNSQRASVNIMNPSNFNWSSQQDCSDFKSCFTDINRLLKNQNITVMELKMPYMQRICSDVYGNVPFYLLISVIHICGFCAAYSLQHISKPEHLYRTWISRFVGWISCCQTEYYHHILIFRKLRNNEPWNAGWKLNTEEINRQDCEGNSFLHIGINKSTMNVDDIKTLINAGFNINCQNQEGKTVLMLAYLKRKIDVFKIICNEMSADGIIAADKLTGDTILHWMFRDKKRDKAYFKMILERLFDIRKTSSVNFNVANKSGVTPIVLSIEHEDHHILNKLLELCSPKHMISQIYMYNPLVLAFKMHNDRMFISLSEKIDVTGFFATDPFSGESLIHNVLMHTNDKYLSSIIFRLSKEILNKSPKTDYIIENLKKESEDDCGSPLDSMTVKFMNPIELLLASVDVVKLNFEMRSALVALAAYGGFASILKLLLKDSDHHTDLINVKNVLGNTPLALAAESISTSTFDMLLDKGAAVRTINKNGSEPLAQAAEWGNVNIVQMLLERGSDVHTTDNDGYTPLACAARGGKDEAVKKLLEKQDSHFDNKSGKGEGNGDNLQLLLERIEKQTAAEINSVTNVDLRKALVGDIFVNASCSDQSSKTFLALKTKRIDNKMCKKLMLRLADFKITLNDCEMPLELAIRMKKVKTAQQLWDIKNTITEVNHKGNTPLSLAAQWGESKVVKLLLKKKSLINWKNEDGNTPLALAALWGKDDIVKLLLDKQANINLDNKNGYTPLALAAQIGNLETVRLLLDKGADIWKADHMDNTPLALAAQQGNDEIIHLLLEKHADMKSANKSGDTSLILASRHGHAKTVKLFVNAGAEMNNQGTNGNTPIAMAAQHGHSKIVEQLVHSGADVNKPNNDGNTPMALAVQWNFAKVVQVLIDSGARRDMANKDGVTPLQLAERSGLDQIVCLLRSSLDTPDCEDNIFSLFE